MQATASEHQHVTDSVPSVDADSPHSVVKAALDFDHIASSSYAD